MHAATMMMALGYTQVVDMQGGYDAEMDAGGNVVVDGWARRNFPITKDQVQADRKRWVEGWVTEGKPLDKVLAVFPPSLHAQIEAYYRQAVEKRKSASGEIWGNEEI